MTICIGIIRETKTPTDNRVPLLPIDCRELQILYPQVKFKIQPSPLRCYKDQEYINEGVQIQEDLSSCDLLLGIKEVARETLLEGKTYMFFSHTIKKQPHNRKMFHKIIKKRNTLIDYELLTDDAGQRLIGFGYWAGMVGAHYGLILIGIKSGAYDLKPGWLCHDVSAMTGQYHEIQIPPVKIVVTGGGRVAKGALEIMKSAGIRKVSKDRFLNDSFSEPIFLQLHSEDLFKAKNNDSFVKKDFYLYPERYESNFQLFTKITDVLINCIYWDPRAPSLFTSAETLSPDFKIGTISDISCDIEGSVPITLRTSTTEKPYMGYDPTQKQITEPFGKNTIDIMAIGNLPNELPRDASADFSHVMKNIVIPNYLKDHQSPLFERATIVRHGELTKTFAYLSDYAEGVEF
ncbi:MAG: NAD(P)-dependent oxidoreductase [Bacteroidota bacterium]|nr:NAD(P)-dependent oxidoreductase [Bacteroidota bacterium]